ncbi:MULTISPECIES: hypothetical protein [Rhodonellum]|uniref:Outer membrane protein beta-barrel domain-containing protein n=1 Tax=Rhodonellum ikkaensis TaxID=336829 RepID=A0A1H3QHP6_9BACT|nr:MULTISPECIES: hypothetical protein [Rhodonellum]MDO9551282.1 hypothetical protein [Rhodonellum sp.]SDZ12209.1 hypothetical protein SAMN05444412_10665 [Rhodonellum ikkaensis]
MQNTRISLIVAIIIFMLPLSGISQDETKREAVFLEGLGSGILYSFNYDWRFKDQANGLGAKVGLGYTAIDGYSVTTLPFAVNYLVGRKRNFLELGLGATVLFLSRTNSTFTSSDPRLTASGLLFNGIIGYRRVAQSGFLLRAGLTPFFSSDPAQLLAPQVSIGYAF